MEIALKCRKLSVVKCVQVVVNCRSLFCVVAVHFPPSSFWYSGILRSLSKELLAILRNSRLPMRSRRSAQILFIQSFSRSVWGMDVRANKMCFSGCGCDPVCPVQTPFRGDVETKRKKVGPKNGKIGHTGEKGEKWPKMAIFHPFWGQFSHFSAIFPRASCPIFSAIFFPFRSRGPKWCLYRAARIARLR